MAVDWDEVQRRNPHLVRYLAEVRAKRGALPDFVETLGRDLKDKKTVDVLYPVGDPIFIHVYDDGETHQRHYRSIEPTLSKEEQAKYRKVKDNVLRLAPYEDTPETIDDLRATLRRLLAKTVTVSSDRKSVV